MSIGATISVPAKAILEVFALNRLKVLLTLVLDLILIVPVIVHISINISIHI